MRRTASNAQKVLRVPAEKFCCFALGKLLVYFFFEKTTGLLESSLICIAAKDKSQTGIIASSHGPY
jgi:hypothetical protein